MYRRGDDSPLKMSFTELLWLFFIYGFAGWCVEVIFHAANKGIFINRGFLIGPICPIYGYGLVAVILALTPIKDNVFLVYIGSVVICSVFELIVGWASEKFMHTRLWDYSDNAFNIGGYVCLKFSLLWGVGCICIIYIFHPMAMKLVYLIEAIPHTHGNILLGILSAIFLADLGITGFNALKLDAHMRAIDEVAKAIEKLSYGIGDGLTDGTLKVQEGRAEAQQDAAELREKLKERREDAQQDVSELRAKLRSLLEERNFVHRHLLNAFPRLSQKEYKSAFDRIQEHRKKKF
jgi:uncharacterized membrane protein